MPGIEQELNKSNHNYNDNETMMMNSYDHGHCPPRLSKSIQGTDHSHLFLLDDLDVEQC